MSNLKIGDRALDFNLPATDGKNYSLDDYKGKKALVVVFSCVHCPYVKAWDGRLISIAREYAGKGAAFVLISANDAVKYPDDSFENMKAHARKMNYPFPFLYNEKQDVARAYGAGRTPEIFLFDSGLNLAYHGTVDDNYEDEGAVKNHYLVEALEAVLSGNPVPVAETASVGCSIKWK